MSMEFDDIVVRFNILDAMKHPSKDHSIFHVDIIDDTVDGLISYFHSLHALIFLILILMMLNMMWIMLNLLSLTLWMLYLLTLLLYNQIALTMLHEVHMHLIVMLRYRLWNPFLLPSGS